MKSILRLLVGLAVAFVAAAFWLLETESGLHWALGFAPRELAAEGVRGALAREISADRVAWEGIEARNVSLQVNLLALLGDTVSVSFVRIDSLDIRLSGEKKAETSGPALPLRIKVSDAQVKSVVFQGYEINDLKLDYTGSALGHDLAATFRGAGARATLKAVLDARARPTRVTADVDGLNLAVIDPDLPQTALRAQLEARGDDKGASGKLALQNPDAGPLDDDRLPLAGAETAFSTDFSSITLRDLKASLRGSGALEGGGRIQGESAQFDLRVRALDLRSVRSNLARTRLAGQLAIAMQPKRQRVQGTLAQDDMSLTADAERSGDEIEVRALRARAAGGEATGRGRLNLGKMSGSSPSFQADLKLAGFDPSRFGDYPKGNLTGTVKGNGSLGAARGGSFTWDLAGSTLLEQPFASSGRARLSGERITDADAWATLGANRATAKGAFGGRGDEVAWTLSIPDLRAVQKNIGGQVQARGA